jgi:Na+-translocating ferredoxin:NAD+ oxidoreductase RNF subunit RnfB
MNLILISMGVLGVTALVAAILLYFVSQFFKVEEDPRIDLVTAVLPGANCGGCGFAGCRAFAEACVKAGGIEGLACPVGGDPTMDEVKKVLTPSSEEPAADSAQPAEGGKKGFDPAVAAKIKALPTPRAVFPLALGIR